MKRISPNRTRRAGAPKVRRQVAGHYDGSGRRFAVCVSRFNEFITRALLAGCLDQLSRHGVAADAIDVFWVPGALELATCSKKIADRKAADAIICLGCVIRGDTAHYDHVCRETAKGIAEIGRRTGLPCIFGVLTVETLEQAIERAGTKMGNAGASAALAALEMASLMEKI
jgi:6,7-dimethyl-8-ribityllumazine synthase